MSKFQSDKVIKPDKYLFNVQLIAEMDFILNNWWKSLDWHFREIMEILKWKIETKILKEIEMKKIKRMKKLKLNNYKKKELKLKDWNEKK